MLLPPYDLAADRGSRKRRFRKHGSENTFDGFISGGYALRRRSKALSTHDPISIQGETQAAHRITQLPAATTWRG